MAKCCVPGPLSAIVGNRFRNRRRHLPCQPDQYCHCTDPPEPIVMPVHPLFHADQQTLIHASRALLEAENKTLFFADADVAATLPAPFDGGCYVLVQTVNSNLAFNGDANLIAKNNATASSATFQTSGQKIGAAMAAVCLHLADDDLRWFIFNLSGQTLTIA